MVLREKGWTTLQTKHGGSLRPGLRGDRRPCPEAESFLSIFIQKGAKVKDLNKKSPSPFLRQTASRSHGQPYISFGKWEAAPGPPIAGSATVYYLEQEHWNTHSHFFSTRVEERRSGC